jgi:predicted acylesterase/phospholipase RssA
LGEATFAEFHAQTGQDLSLVAADISSSDLLVLNHRTAPQCPVVWAVRMSMSVPFAWQEVIWRAEWGTYLDRDITDHRIVDGGLLSNFPIEYLISKDKEVVEVMGDTDGSPNVLGLLIDEALAVPGADEVPKTNPLISNLNQFDVKELEIVRRISNLVDTALSGHGKIVIDAYEEFVCRLPAKGYGTLEFEMTDQRLAAIIDAGRMTMDAYFDRQP